MKKIELIVESLLSGNNVFITGSLGSGKTTLFKKVLSQLADFTLIETKKSGALVQLFFESEQVIIGRRQKDAMSSCLDGFDLAVFAIEQFLMGDKSILAIDEIGFLEARRTDYLELITKSGQQKTVLAVLRKDNHALVDYLKDFEPYIIINLDD